MISSTNEKIRYAAYKLFLEKGYEATNIRDICMEAGIKASSLYFYYLSKQDLFFSIYDEIWNDNISFMETINEKRQNISPDIFLFNLFKSILEYCSNDITKQKFLLRYHLFPPESIKKELRQKFKYWTNKENVIVLKMINDIINNHKKTYNDRNINDYIDEYVKFIKFQIIEMIITNIKLSSTEIYSKWTKFCNSKFLLTSSP